MPTINDKMKIVDIFQITCTGIRSKKLSCSHCSLLNPISTSAGCPLFILLASQALQLVIYLSSPKINNKTSVHYPHIPDGRCASVRSNGSQEKWIHCSANCKTCRHPGTAHYTVATTCISAQYSQNMSPFAQQPKGRVSIASVSHRKDDRKMKMNRSSRNTE